MPSRILDLGWRHTAKALWKKEVGLELRASEIARPAARGHIFYGRWCPVCFAARPRRSYRYSLVWGGSPKAKQEVEETLVHNTGVVRWGSLGGSHWSAVSTQAS